MPDADVEEVVDEIDYPESDGKPMAETDFHRKQMNETIDRLAAWFAGRSDVYVSGNLFVYYQKGDRTKCLAPDCLVVLGVPAGDRRMFKAWKEGRLPDFVLEITSRKTRAEDRGEKLRIYRDIWKVREYLLFDPRQEYLTPSFQGHRLVEGEYQPIPLAHGQLHSEVLGLKFERAGVRLVIRDPVTGREVLTAGEEAARRAEDARELSESRASVIQAELEEAIENRLEVRAELDRMNATQSELLSEVARLRAELAALRNPPAP